MRKYSVLFILLLSVVLLCTACQKEGNDESQNTEKKIENTESVQNEEETEVLPEAPEDNFSILSEEELDWFETEFFNTEDNRIVNMFLTSEYEIAADINLSQLFYGGTYGTDTQEVTQEEIEAIKQTYDVTVEVDTFKVTTDEMNAILEKYLNLSLEETNKVNLEGLYYLEEYDAYYSVVGDTEWAPYVLDYGWINGDGSITIQYVLDPDFGVDENLYQVTLKEVDGNYYFISNYSVK